MLSKGHDVPSQSRDWGLPLEGAPVTLLPTVLCQRPPIHAMHISHLPTPAPSGLFSRPHFTASLEACELEVTSSTPLLSSMVASWRRGTYPLARRLLRGRMIWEIVMSQEPKKGLWAVPLLVDPAEQLLPRSYRCALSHQHSGYCSWLISFHHSISWTDNPTCPECHASDHTVAHLFSSPTYPTDLAPGDM